MARLDGIDTSTAEALREGFQPIPPGDYMLFMESSEKTETRDGNGEYLKCVFVVANGEFEGAKITANFNFWNQNQKAVDIAKSQWRALCEAVLNQPTAINNESSSLHNKIFIGQVSNKPRNDDATKRTNELVFLKGTIRSSAEGIKKEPVKAETQKSAPVNKPWMKK
jgi:hypothetical protein